MPTKADYHKVATTIASYMNAYHLAFKAYRVADFDEMIKADAGAGARVSGNATSIEFESALLRCGFTIFPNIADAGDGWVRVYRTGSLIANLLNAFTIVGPESDNQLAHILTKMRNRSRADDFSPGVDEAV